ncbi:MAG TPA: heavy metal-associated domain-containing protein [Candidatus Baltobacteraceae bacterium]|jgi:Cu+-exporting ATPase
MDETTTTLRIGGMTCENCARHVTDALAGVPGVRAARVDLAGGTATIDADAGVSREAIAAALADEGYDLL